jgi:hypothetical protein
MSYQVWRTFSVTERVVIENAVDEAHAVKIAEHLAPSLFKTEDVTDPVYTVVNNEEQTS